MRKRREQEPTQVWPVGHGVDYGQHLESWLHYKVVTWIGCSWVKDPNKIWLAPLAGPLGAKISKEVGNGGIMLDIYFMPPL